VANDAWFDLTDPRAIRALAHPLRLRILRLLRHDGPATATSVSSQLGESTGATSFHLRQLAKYGFISELPERGTTRERWWQATARGYRFPTNRSDIPELEPAAMLLLDTVINEDAEAIAHFRHNEERLDPMWRNAALFAHSTAHLTLDEMDALSEDLTALLCKYERHDPSERPPRAERVRFILYALPEATENDRGARDAAT
jgi:DNA-binding transcriptional ArsR family regulator